MTAAIAIVVGPGQEMPILAIIAAWMIGGYMAGSIPFGWLIGKARGVDIREHGSRNIGATNCGRVCGWPYGALAFILDVAKGFLPVGAATMWFLWGEQPMRWGGDIECHLGYPESYRVRLLAVVLVGSAAILGHTFPVWLKFKGGKAVATALGVVLAMPMLTVWALAAFGVWIVVTGLSRYVSVGSTVAALALAGLYLGFERDRAWTDYLPVTVFVLLVVALVIVRHRSNYLRLWRGTENKVWGGKKINN
jgi:glycerol-3-phosphate acyltransferase PlsY